MGFEPVTSRYRCDALPTELWSHWRWEQVSCGFICSRERNECLYMIYEMNHMWTAEMKWNEGMIVACSETQFMQLRKEAWKKFRTSTGFKPVVTQNWPAPNVNGFIAQLVEHRTGIVIDWRAEFFSGFFTQFDKLRFTATIIPSFHFISAVRIWFISYIINKLEHLGQLPEKWFSCDPGRVISVHWLTLLITKA